MYTQVGTIHAGYLSKGFGNDLVFVEYSTVLMLSRWSCIAPMLVRLVEMCVSPDP